MGTSTPTTIHGTVTRLVDPDPQRAIPARVFMQNIGPVIEHLKGVTSPAPPAPAAPGAPGRIVLTGESAKRVSNAVRTLMGRGYSLEQAQELAERALALGI